MATKKKAEGVFDKMKGRAREAAGAVRGDKSQRAKGQGEQVKGEGKKKFGEAKEKLTD